MPFRNFPRTCGMYRHLTSMHQNPGVRLSLQIFPTEPCPDVYSSSTFFSTQVHVRTLITLVVVELSLPSPENIDYFPP